MRTELQINPVPIARISVNKPCAECDESGSKAALAEETGTDRVTLSTESQEALEKEEESSGSGSAEGRPRGADGQPVSEKDARIIKQLEATDREVRSHEQAHKAAAGPYAIGGPTYEYTTGPDGKRYAVGGEVKIDTAPVPDNPEATIVKAQTIRRAALAPADPSGKDRQVAAKATQIERQARQQIQEEQREENQEKAEKAEEEGSSVNGTGQENATGTEVADQTSATPTTGTGGTFGNTSGTPAEQNPFANSKSSNDNPFTRRQTSQFTDSPAPEAGQLLNLFT